MCVCVCVCVCIDIYMSIPISQSIPPPAPKHVVFSICYQPQIPPTKSGYSGNTHSFSPCTLRFCAPSAANMMSLRVIWGPACFAWGVEDRGEWFWPKSWFHLEPHSWGMKGRKRDDELFAVSWIHLSSLSSFPLPPLLTNIYSVLSVHKAYWIWLSPAFRESQV